MGGHHFQFKQFGIGQSRCAMKVSTDACLLGAWAPFTTGIPAILDIGCGTGLLSLMLVQRFPKVQITALELDPDAAEQAAENVRNSPGAERVKVIEDNVLTYDFKGKKFAGIICNPPFFQNSLGSQLAARHTARHHDDLPLAALLLKIEELLPAGGQLALLLPPATQLVWERLATETSLVQVQKVLVQPLPHKAPNRVQSLWEKGSPALMSQLFGRALQTETLILYETYGNYTPAATALLAPFLLKL